MVRFSRFFGTVAFVSTLIVVSAFAESSSVSARAAFEPADCWFFDATGAPFQDPAADLRLRLSDNGGYSVTCTGELPPEAVLPDGVMQWDPSSQPGYICFGTVDEDWKGTTWPSGKAKFTCHGKL